MNDANIISSLDKLLPIALETLSATRLMNRIDIKYVFPVKKAEDLIRLVDNKYKVLEINKIRAFPYHTTYYDTPDYLFYYQHIRGEFGRHKIRYRRYESFDTSYLEIKMKNNKRRTIKWRILNNQLNSSFDDRAKTFIAKHLPVDSNIIKPVLVNRFNRVTLVGQEPAERITIDYNISYNELTGGRETGLPHIAVVEIKKTGQSMSSDFGIFLKKLGIHPTAFSKYCTGSAMLNDNLKKNMIKPKLLLLKKLENEYN